MKKIATLLLCMASFMIVWQGATSYSSRANAERTSVVTLANVSTATTVAAAAKAAKAASTPKSQAASETKQEKSANELFEQAVAIIKKYEGLHQPKHWPLVGYGHLVKKGETYSRSKAMSEKEAEALLRKDLLKNCAVFREFGKDSLILGVLAYNIGSGNVKRSSVVTKLRNGNRDIRQNFIAHCRYKGKEMSQIKRRRIEEFETLFLHEKDSTLQVASSKNIQI